MEALWEVIKLWLPFLILIAVWIFFMRRAGVGGSFQKAVLEEMKVQTKEQADIVRHLDRIATALENRKP